MVLYYMTLKPWSVLFGKTWYLSGILGYGSLSVGVKWVNGLFNLYFCFLVYVDIVFFFIIYLMYGFYPLHYSMQFLTYETLYGNILYFLFVWNKVGKWDVKWLYLMRCWYIVNKRLKCTKIPELFKFLQKSVNFFSFGFQFPIYPNC